MKAMLLGLLVFVWLGFMAVMAILTMMNCLNPDKLGFYLLWTAFFGWLFWFVCKRKSAGR